MSDLAREREISRMKRGLFSGAGMLLVHHLLNFNRLFIEVLSKNGDDLTMYDRPAGFRELDAHVQLVNSVLDDAVLDLFK